ncbi:hypothetical protein CVT26_008892 [Gymnopilus dilepis]|uniref:F-box domain-containing protein n=1 Tax=Gymnopilus dilepis TaxID=231916 RepID=A0A409YAX3_9AGAR|nr:hypothetical protein CVT26_008892 [Gymnopilus dilepis]
MPLPSSFLPLLSIASLNTVALHDFGDIPPSVIAHPGLTGQVSLTGCAFSPNAEDFDLSFVLGAWLRCNFGRRMVPLAHILPAPALDIPRVEIGIPITSEFQSFTWPAFRSLTTLIVSSCTWIHHEEEFDFAAFLQPTSSSLEHLEIRHKIFGQQRYTLHSSVVLPSLPPVHLILERGLYTRLASVRLCLQLAPPDDLSTSALAEEHIISRCADIFGSKAVQDRRLLILVDFL